MEVTTIIVFLIAGTIAGTLAGLIGIGGGIIYVPAILFYLEHYKPEVSSPHIIAVTTSLLIIFFTTFSATTTHWKRGNVMQKYLPALGAGGAMGAFLGILLVKNINTGNYSFLLGMLLVYVGWGIVRPKKETLQDETSEKPIEKKKVFFTGAASGGIAAFFGVGGGLITVPLLHMNGMKLSKAVGTSSALMILSAGFSMSLMVANPDILTDFPGIWRNIYVPVALAILPTAIIFSKVGARLAYFVDGPKVKWYFGFFVLVMGSRWLAIGLNEWLQIF